MEEKYIFDEVTEPFEWPVDVPTMEESMKRLNEILNHNGVFMNPALNDYFNKDYDPIAMKRGADNIKALYEVLGLRTYNLELKPEDCMIASKWPIEHMTDGLNKIIVEARENNGTD